MQHSTPQPEATAARASAITAAKATTETSVETPTSPFTAPNRNLDHLPGNYGLPVFGNTFSVLKNARDFHRKRHAQYGPVYKSSVFFHRGVTLADADAAQYVLMDKAQNFSSSKGWFRLKDFIPRGIIVRDFADHRKHRRPLQQAFKSAVMTAYAKRLNVLLKQGIESWPTDTEFLFQPHIKSLLLDNAASIFLGAELGEESDKLNKAFVDFLGGILVFARLRIPGTNYDRAKRGIEYLEKWLYDRVDERSASEGDDIFTALCHLGKDPENGLSRADIVGHTLLILFAAHDTTTSALSTMMSEMCEHPQWQTAMREELLGLDDDQLSFAQTAELDVTDRVFRETLRCHPAVFIIPRRSINAFEYKGHKIPANTLVHIPVDHIQHDSANWTDPDKFDPDRFLPERAEHRRHPFQWIPFGGGAHKCLGFKFADMQVKIFLFHLLRNYKIEPSRGGKASFAIDLIPIPLPRDRLPVKMSRL